MLMMLKTKIMKKMMLMILMMMKKEKQRLMIMAPKRTRVEVITMLDHSLRVD